MTITFIVSFRDREPERVIRSLNSLLDQSNQDFMMIFVDYGSSKKNSLTIQKVLNNYPFCKYVYSDTRGWLWNRGAALNIGTRLCSTQYMVFTDIDVVYQSDFVEEIFSKMKEDVFIVANTARVPKEFNDWGNIPIGKYRHQFKLMVGYGIACYSKDVLEKIGGCDEQYAYWGNEDQDLVERVMHYGLKEQFDEELCSYHQWHPQTHMRNIPHSILFHNVSRYYCNIDENPIYRNQKCEWGRIIPYDERPIYKYFDPENNVFFHPETVLFRDAHFMNEIHKWAGEIGVHKNTLWAISKNNPDGKGTVFLNKFLRRINYRISHTVTYLDDFAQGLVLSAPNLFKDYYLDCRIGSKRYSIFLS